MEKHIIIVYLIINLIAFILYGIDKKRAINNKWRISEKVLLGIAVFGGGIGAFLGMRIFHHKTKKTIFRIWIPLWIVLHVVLVLWLNERISITKSDDSTAVSVIGKADGPTSVFIAGKVGDNEEKIVNEAAQTVEEPISYINSNGINLKERINTPKGYERIEEEADSFEEFIRKYPLKEDGAKVLLYDGREKGNQDAHIAVFDMPIDNYDLQQCADSVIRIYAEYFWNNKQYEKIAFYFTNGFLAEYSKWIEGNRIVVNGNDVSWSKQTGYDDSYESFVEYLHAVFMYAGTLSMEGEASSIELNEAKVGDVFLKGASPGHVIMICDICENAEGKRAYLLCQGYMPAQEFHVLKNNNHKEDPWYYEDEIIYPFNTPEYTFNENSLKRLSYN